MTLSEILPGARRLSIVEKLQLIQLLAADLDISPLEPFKTYDVPSRYNDFGAAKVLIEILDRWRSLSQRSLTFGLPSLRDAMRWRSLRFALTAID